MNLKRPSHTHHVQFSKQIHFHVTKLSYLFTALQIIAVTDQRSSMSIHLIQSKKYLTLAVENSHILIRFKRFRVLFFLCYQNFATMIRAGFRGPF